MADPIADGAPALAESAAPAPDLAPPSIEDAFQAASDALDQQESAKAPAAAPETPAPEGQAAGKADEPEELRWVKSTSGLVDPSTGAISTERLAKQAFEANKQLQTQARTLSQLQTLLQIPKIAQVLAEVTGTAQPKPTEAAEPQTDEQILEAFVQQRIQQALGPAEQRLQALYARHEESQFEACHKQLQEEFGKTEDGQHFVYDTVARQVGEQIESVAARANVNPRALLSHLIANGMLYETFQSAARNVLFGTIQQKAKAAQEQASSATLAQKKRTQLTAVGSPARSVATVQKSAASFEDAAELAEKELGITA